MGLSCLGSQNQCWRLVPVFRDIFLQIKSMRLVGNVSVGGDIHPLAVGPQTGICEAQRGGFVPWELRGPEQSTNSIGCYASIVVSLMGEALDDDNQDSED